MCELPHWLHLRGLLLQLHPQPGPDRVRVPAPLPVYRRQLPMPIRRGHLPELPVHSVLHPQLPVLLLRQHLRPVRGPLQPVREPVRVSVPLLASQRAVRVPGQHHQQPKPVVCALQHLELRAVRYAQPVLPVRGA